MSCTAKPASGQTGTMDAGEDNIIQVKGLEISFKTDEGLIRAVDGVDFSVGRGRTLGLVGESGSGKSVSTWAIMKLLPKSAVIHENSSILLKRKDGNVIDITKLNSSGQMIEDIRGGDVSIVFQEPMSSFSPVYTIGNQISEAIMLHRRLSKQEAREIAVNMLDRVGIPNPARRFNEYPFELSGGMRQRAMIAIALCTHPSLLIADEPTTALDVTIQAQVLELMKELQSDLNMSTIFITHNLGVIAQMADEIAVMYLGGIVERGLCRDIFFDPKHPYTVNLLRAIPRLGRARNQRLVPISGMIPSPLERPPGCRFHTRCEQMIPGRCNVYIPETVKITENHTVDCFLYSDSV
ncbi:oligopeptide ABC transporter, ATP-binding protein [Candidatus Vecturithrix granuli]|uniref:Oligopeptide ABC transporter, ATP-binding protein n=1 Tax=Vecturithrix granuli TaxID=1499967 RepID=A0A081CAG9_VECG1|nr:oligopeptide ABC transporter, ATP-binding protein [Candidatus Vecturithrix granuli]